MNHETFDQLRVDGYQRIPVVRSILADLDTPLSVYLKLADGPNAFLFESVQGGEQWGRYSFIGLPAQRVYKAAADTVVCEDHGVETGRWDNLNPLDFFSELMAQWKVPETPDLPPFCGGLVGYFGYETIGLIESRLAGVLEDSDLAKPDILLMETLEVAVFDNLAGRLHLVVNADAADDDAWSKAQRRLDQLVHRLRHGTASYPAVVGAASLDEDAFTSEFGQQDFEAAVHRSKQYILAGDIMQVVLSQRLTTPFQARPVDVYRALRSLNPSPYMFFLDMGQRQIVGSSPEILVRVMDRKMTVRPIAGTRPRGDTPAQDQRLEEELLADEKERAEHLMLIDLGRNDLGRVAQPGTVELTETMGIERYSHVMHIVSEVVGQLRESHGVMDALKATFPAGTLSGAPKIRAMEIIDELEPTRRGVYAGAVGYLNWSGDTDLAIAIRTAVIENGQLTVQAGAGIVADSDPAREWEETMNKGRAIFHAVSQATQGL